jgi:hypothetical protein
VSYEIGAKTEFTITGCARTLRCIGPCTTDIQLGQFVSDPVIRPHRFSSRTRARRRIEGGEIEITALIGHVAH